MGFVLLTFIVFLVSYANFVIAQDAPFEDTSYEARGEIIVRYSKNETISMMFEENFDIKSARSVLVVRLLGLTTTLFEDMNLNQTLKYEDGEIDGKTVQICRLYKPKEWISVHNPPDLEIFEVNQGTVFFPLMQLLWGLSSKFQKPGTEVTSETYREIPCNKWLYQVNYTSADKTADYIVDIEAYWSSGEWNITAKETVVPVGFVIHHNGINKTSGKPINVDQYVNVMYFTKDAFNKDAFLPKQGIYCPGRVASKPFPNFGDFEGLSVSLEFDWMDNRLISSVDMKIDRSNQVIQIEYDPMDQAYDPLNPKKKKSSVLIANFQQTVAYDRRQDSCQVTPIKINYDVQTIYDVEYLSTITTEHFFGHKLKYIFIGETVKRGIPCNMWQAERRDWPKSEPTITTVWEWCIAERVGNPVMFEDGVLPIVSLDITVTESDLTVIESAFTLGTKFSYNFYEVMNRTSSYLRTTEFDISSCFKREQKEWLQFKVNVPPKLTETIKNATVDADFIDKWRTVIYGGTGLLPFTLRVAKVRTILAKTVLLVQFILLDRHVDMPAYVAKDVDLKNAKDRLKQTIDGNALSIDWKNMVLKALPGSLETPFQITQRTVGPPSRITTAITEYTTNSHEDITESTKTTKSSTASNTIQPITDERVKTTLSSTKGNDVITDAPKEEKRTMGKRHSSGTMAGLGIGMLLLGFSLGAGGTFTKFRYFPTTW